MQVYAYKYPKMGKPSCIINVINDLQNFFYLMISIGKIYVSNGNMKQ